MFLKKLYRYKKWLCGFFIAFIFVFVFLNYKQGLVFSPIYQYGMYSTKMHKADTVSAYEIYLNGKRLDASQYSFAERDQMYVSLDNYLKSGEINKSVYTDMTRILSKAGVAKLMTEEKYSNSITDAEFTAWYRKLLKHYSKENVDSFTVFSQQYLWLNDSLKPVSSPIKVIDIGADR